MYIHIYIYIYTHMYAFRSLWDVGYFTTADQAIDSPNQMNWTGTAIIYIYIYIYI